MTNLVTELINTFSKRKDNRVALTYRLTPDAHSALKKYAKENHLTISSIITQALLEYFQKRVKEAENHKGGVKM